MSHWDRVGLLELVDVARNSMNDTTISEAKRHQLRALVDRYSVKTQSIEASRKDVLALEEEISRIVGAPCNSN